jgi:alpha-beta hydrolase superfamily lysophospholipase
MEAIDTNFDLEIIPLEDDYEGKVIATLIKSKANTGNRKSVLYIHGFVDYFFHPHVAQKFHDNGFDFYALDMRKYGRSLLAHQHACYCKSLDEYNEEISHSIKKINAASGQKVILLGHSTGGLIVSRYANDGAEKNLVSALILNSPFLEMNTPKIELGGLKFIHKWLMKLLPPYAVAQKHMPEAYVKSIHKNYNGEWDFNLTWKPLLGFPAYFIWLKTIIDNQEKLKASSNISIPLLLLHSSNSFIPKKNSTGVDKADIILNVEHMKQLGPKLGSKVTLMEVKDGMHDIFLSKETARNTAFDKMGEWLKNNGI